MQRKILLVTTLALLSALVSCNGAGDVSSKSTPSNDETKYEDEVITTNPGDVIGYETEFRYNKSLDLVANKKGKIETLGYTTDVYENGITYQKKLNVYLPYGYNQNDTNKKYNVLYFQHGNTGMITTLTNSTPKKRLDNLFDPDRGGIDPMIVVFPTYYFNTDENRETIQSTGNAPAGDGRWKEIKGNYNLEFIQNIMPLVEGKYNTYTESTDDEGLKTSRNHRAISGYSRGSAWTWTAFHKMFEYFEWYSPMSCQVVGDGLMSMEDGSAPLSKKQMFEYIKEPIALHPELDFYIFAASGNANDASGMRSMMDYFTKQTDTFSYGKDPKKNNIYYSLSEYDHADIYVPLYYYNSLKVLFH